MVPIFGLLSILVTPTFMQADVSASETLGIATEKPLRPKRHTGKGPGCQIKKLSLTRGGIAYLLTCLQIFGDRGVRDIVRI